MAIPLSRTDQKRASILQAGVDEFQRLGFENASMDGIAEAAGVSKRTVYNHFQSKEGLFEAIMDMLFEEQAELLVTPYSSDDSLEDQLTSIGTAYGKMIRSTDYMKLSRIAISRFMLEPGVAKDFLSRQASLRARFTVWIHDAANDGRLTVEHPEIAATQFAALLKSLAFWPQLIAQHPPLSDRELTTLVHSTVAMFLDHYEMREMGS